MPQMRGSSCSGDDVGGASDGTSKTQSVKFDLPLSDSVRGKSTLDGLTVAVFLMGLIGLVGFVGPIGLIGLIWAIGL